MDTDAVLQSMRALICALDIVVSIISLSSLYTPLFWRSWTYEKGMIIRRDLWISRIVVFSIPYRLIGTAFSIASLFRNQERHTLILKTIQAVTATPLEIRLYKLGRRTWKKAVADGGHTTMPDPTDVPQRESALPKSQQVLVASNADRDDYQRPEFGFFTACLFHIKWIIPEGIIVVGLVFTSVCLNEGRKDRLAAAVLIWILPLIAVIINQVWRCVGRRTAADGEFHGFTVPWVVGTILGFVVFLVVFFIDLEDRKKHISNWTEVWIQLAEALCGGGG